MATVGTYKSFLGACLAKTEDFDGAPGKGINVMLHSEIVGLVMKELLCSFRSNLPKVFRSLLGDDPHMYEKYIPFWAALHDVGKVGTPFQAKIYGALGLRPSFIPPGSHPEGEFRHQVVTSCHLRRHLSSRKQVELLHILDGHHGTFASDTTIKEGSEFETFSTEEWVTERDLLIQILYRKFVGSEVKTVPLILKEVSQALLSLNWNYDQILAIAGFVCTADWIGSSIGKKELRLGPNMLSVVKSKVLASGFIGYKLQLGMSFEKVFGFSPNSMQDVLLHKVAQEGPGVYILEGPMGFGKTEAALYAAYELLASGKASGIYFAMPTQVTSDKIFERVNDTFLSRIVKGGHSTSNLVHSSAASNSAWGARALPGKYFFTKKKALLSPFGVGTVDQCAMVAINVRHKQVRSAGLYGKVVIIDEVHSYDSYTTFIIRKAIDSLRNAGATVIILSATLTANARNELLGESNGYTGCEYPLISSAKGSTPAEPVKGNDVKIIKSPNLEAMQEAIDRYNKGELVLWIENTVNDALEAYQEFLSQTGTAPDDLRVGLIHSRFLKKDRSLNESFWISLYGKGGDRSKGRILVGTQVLEQSIDIDADFLVTKICPMDMLLQRIGRLWRHRANDVARPSKQAVAYIVNPHTFDKVKLPYGVSSKVYSDYDLASTEMVLDRFPIARLPEDIRSMLESAANNIDPTLTGYMDTKKANETKLIEAAMKATGKFLEPVPDEKAAVRMIDQPTVNLILVDSYTSKQICVGGVTYLGGNKATMANVLSSNSVSITAINMGKTKVALVPPAWLGGYLYQGTKNDQNYIAILKPDGSITDASGQATGFCYHCKQGLIIPGRK